jgi:hypothetical protein
MLAGADPDGVDVSAGDCRGGAVGEGEPKLKDQARRRSAETTGIRASSLDGVSGLGDDECEVDRRRSWATLSRPGERRHRRHPALRAKAQAQGNLQTRPSSGSPSSSGRRSSPRSRKPSPAAARSQTTVRIEPADPQVVYVPTYNPTQVYGGGRIQTTPVCLLSPGYAWRRASPLLSFGTGMAAAHVGATSIGAAET